MSSTGTATPGTQGASELSPTARSPSDRLEEFIWVQHGPIRTAAPVLRAVPNVVNVHDLIACPTCRARVDETCKSSGGAPRIPHVTRLAPRLCSCGRRLGCKKQLCELCRVAARAETYRLRDRRRPTAQRRLRGVA